MLNTLGGILAGRRATTGMEFAVEVATIAKIWGTRSPFRVMWTRVDDIRGGFYRTLTAHHIRSSVDPAGSIAGWEHAVAGDSFVTGTSMEGTGVKDGMDNMMIEGAKELPYEIPNRRLGAHILKTGVPTLWWCSVGHPPTAYAVETILDELLELGGKEPVQGWIELMGNHPRELGLLKKVAQMASWNGAKIGNGHARGVAVHKRASHKPIDRKCLISNCFTQRIDIEHDF